MTDTRQAVIEAAACMNPDSDGVEFVSADFLMALNAHTAAVRAESQPQWQPIETAPKDGLEFIAWWTSPAGDMGAVVTHWLDNTGTSAPWAGWRMPSLRASRPGAKPTHWMPLPSAPKGPHV